MGESWPHSLPVIPEGLVRDSLHFRSVTCCHEAIAKSRDLLGLPLLICKARLMLVSTSKGYCEHQMGHCLLGAECAASLAPRRGSVNAHRWLGPVLRGRGLSSMVRHRKKTLLPLALLFLPFPCSSEERVLRGGSPGSPPLCPGVGIRREEHCTEQQAGHFPWPLMAFQFPLDSLCNGLTCCSWDLNVWLRHVTL